jgi:hypothetical protein
MGIETSADHGGAEASFMSAIIAIEELAKIDPSVSVLCDVHNTLVNTILRMHGTEAQKAKYLPDLAQGKVCSPSLVCESNFHSDCLQRLVPSVSRKLQAEVTPLLYKLGPRKMETIGSSMGPRCRSVNYDVSQLTHVFAGGSQTATRRKYS